MVPIATRPSKNIGYLAVHLTEVHREFEPVTIADCRGMGAGKVGQNLAISRSKVHWK
jgi:hypothetical protein